MADTTINNDHFRKQFENLRKKGKKFKRGRTILSGNIIVNYYKSQIDFLRLYLIIISE